MQQRNIYSTPAYCAGGAPHAVGDAYGAGEGVHDVQVGGADRADELKKLSREQQLF